MKKVHAAKQLMHLFCNMTNAHLEGFKTPSRNIYFERGVLYSYGSHYPMAVKTSFGVGHAYREVVLINAEKSSKTTQKHKSQLRSSTKHTQWVFEIPNILDPKAVENSDYLMNEIVDSIDAILRGLKYHYVDELTRRVERYNQFAQAFKLKTFKLDAEFYTDLAIKSRDTEKKNSEKEKLREAKLDAERAANRALWASEVALWYSCKNTRNVSSSYFGLDYDPVRVRGSIVESPRGVHVGIDDAKAFCALLKAGQVKKGMHLGEFAVLEIDSEIVEIGCHRINIKQALEAVLGA